MVTRIILSLLLSLACCSGQSYTLKDISFLGALQGRPGYPYGCEFTRNVAAYWKINEGGTSLILNDSTTNHLTASLVGSPPPVWTTNGINVGTRTNVNAITFSSVDSSAYINCGTSTTWCLTTNNYSITCWLIRPSVPVVDYETAIFNVGLPTAQLYFRFGLRGNPAYVFETIDGTAVGPSPSLISTTAWTFWCLVRDTSSLYIWTNGVLAASAPVSGYRPLNGSPRLVMGTDIVQGPDRHWRGSIEEVRVYKNYALTATDIGCLYHQLYGQ